MQDSISLTIPKIPEVLRAAAQFLLSLAGEAATCCEPLDTQGETAVKTSEILTALNEHDAKAVETSEPTAEQVFTPQFVELADGIPWDARIHSSSRKTYAAAPHGWKLKRGVDPELVKQVEAELRGVMAVPTPETVSETPPPPPATEQTDATPPPPPATETVKPTTFIELVQAINKNGIPQDAVDAAVKSVGVDNLSLIAARPDLIPAVVTALGL